MDNIEQVKEKKTNSRGLIVLNILLGLALVGVVLFMWSPWQGQEYSTEDGQWIKDIVGEHIVLPGVDFYDNCYVRYSGDTLEMVLSYASQEESEIMLEQFLGLIDSPVQNTPPHEGAVAIEGMVQGLPVSVDSRFEEICYIYTITLDFSGTAQAEEYATLISESYPTELAQNCTQTAQFVGEATGGYVFYEYDMFDKLRYAKVPQYSAAYVYDGGQEGFEEAVEEIMTAYPQDSSFDEQNNQAFFEWEGQRITLSYINRQGSDDMVSVSFQRVPE